MLHYIYCRPLIVIVLFMAMAVIAWSALPSRIAAKYCRRGNAIIVLLMFVAILYVTLLNHSEGITGLALLPLATFTAAQQQPELYREMLMNMFFFFPLV